MPRSRLLLILGVTLPLLACILIGFTHPMRLTAESAAYWQGMHIALIPLFPLIGAAPWLIARRVDRRLGWVAGVFGFGFAAFYTALDILAGVAAGTVVLAGIPEATSSIYVVARILAWVGVISLALGVLVAGIAVFQRARLVAIPATLIAGVGALLVQPGHIYFPVGTLAMLLLGAGFTILAVAVTRDASVVEQPAGTGSTAGSRT
ncbi:hypothetical protein [Marisediminicola senii]|uniref:hypothetical protein n=1 Tax=Marisediminicola senii TaxID=2711233 RepID=UPI0013EDC398|nr:hypothetical protein [Marisediminicola senii]